MDKPQGVPAVGQFVIQTIYTERVAKLSKNGSVAEVVRRYDKANRKSTEWLRPLKSKLLEGLEVLYRLQPDVVPQVLSLTGRQLRREEFETIAEQTFLPALTMILPRQPARMGDTWAIPPCAAWALLGSQPLEDGYDMTGEVMSVRKNTSGTSMTAVIDVKGQCIVKQGRSGINALLHFTFEPSPAQAASSSAGRTRALPSGDVAATKPGADQPAEGNFDAKGFDFQDQPGAGSHARSAGG